MILLIILHTKVSDSVVEKSIIYEIIHTLF